MKRFLSTGVLLLLLSTLAQPMDESRSLRGDLVYYLQLLEEGNWGGCTVVAPYLAIEWRVLEVGTEQGWDWRQEMTFRGRVWAVAILSHMHRWDLSEPFAKAARNMIQLPLEAT